MDRIKRLSYQVLDEHRPRFGGDFADNKRVLDEVSIIRSKGLKNEVAGYITKFIKKEILQEKIKQSQIDALLAEQEAEAAKSAEAQAADADAADPAQGEQPAADSAQDAGSASEAQDAPEDEDPARDAGAPLGTSAAPDPNND